MFSMDVTKALLDASDDGKTSIAKVVESVCKHTDFYYKLDSDIEVDTLELVHDMMSWASTQSIAIMWARDVMTYMLDTYGISFSVPLETNDERGMNILDMICHNMTASALSGDDPVIGREEEIEATINTMLRRTKRNPLLVGPAGVGKTAVARGVAQRIASGNVPRPLMGRMMYSLDVASMLEGTGVRGSLATKMNEIITAAVRTNSILFIDEIHALVRAGGNSGENAADKLKPALATGELCVIGATTEEEYHLYVEEDGALERRFSRIEIDEPTIDEATTMLEGMRELYSSHHMVTIPEDIPTTCSNLAKRYMSSRRLPDSALDVMDIACVNAVARATGGTNALASISNWRGLIKEGSFGKASVMKPRYNVSRRSRAIVTPEDVQLAVSNLSRRKVYMSEKDQLKDLEDNLKRVIIGQDSPLEELCRLLRTGYVYSGTKTLGCLLLIGTAGCGKSYTAEQIAEIMFEGNILTLDCANYSEAFTVSNLIGSPKGYVGYNEGGSLTTFVKNHPSAVIVFDDIENAHPNVINLLIGMLGNGKIVDANNSIVDFSGILTILTTNKGTEAMAKEKVSVGFGGGRMTTDEKKGIVDKEIGALFPYQLLDRIHAKIIYNTLTTDDIKKIMDLELVKMTEGSNGPKVVVTDEAKDHLLEDWSTGDGARELMRILKNEVLDSVSKMYIEGKYSKDSIVTISVDDNELIFEGAIDEDNEVSIKD